MLFLIISITFITVASIIYIITLWIKLKPYNQKPLDIKTFDGSSSPYHPSVLYFKDRWNGYKYWMAETPFSPKGKPYRDRNECPSIHVSNDGITWADITANPLDDLNEKEIKELDYFSDPHLIFVDEHIECWYRFTHRYGVKDKYDDLQLVRKCSNDGINWSTREVIVNLATNEGDSLGNMVVSPAILYHNGKYRMWYVNSESRAYRELSYSESTNGKQWSLQRKCILKGSENTPWHIDVNYIDGKYYLLSYDFTDITLWESNDGITFDYIKKLLKPSVIGSFYSEGLYRACIIKDTDFKIYFSSNDAQKTYIGLISGDNISNLKISSKERHKTFVSFIKYVCVKKWISIKFITNRLLKRIHK